MTVTIDWDPTTPLAPASVSVATTGVTAIQDLKTAIHERMRNGGAFWATASGATTIAKDGRLVCGLIGTNVLNLYETDVTTTAININDSTKVVTLGDGTDKANRYEIIINGTYAPLGASAGDFVATTGNITVGATHRTVHTIATATTARTVTLPFPDVKDKGRLVTISYLNTTGTGTMAIGGGAVQIENSVSDFILTPSATNAPTGVTLIYVSGSTGTWYVLEKF